MSRKVVNKGGHGVGAPYDFPAYEYDPVNDSFKDLETGKTFNKNGGAKLEANKLMTITANGTTLVTPSPTYAGMEKVTLDVQVPQGGDIEANKAATIDVSAYTEPVEVTPTAGKDGMAKATVTLSNIPGGNVRLYSFDHPGNTSWPYWSLSQDPAIGDTIAGSEYEQSSLSTMYTVLDIKTVAELKASDPDWVSYFNNAPGWNDDTKFYQVDNQGGAAYMTDWVVLITEDPDYDPQYCPPAYIDL